MFKHVIQHKNNIWVALNHFDPQKNPKACEYSISFLKLPFPGTLLMAEAIWRQHNADKIHTNNKHATVGIKPDRANVAGNVNIAGPVNEFTAIDTEPNIPIVPSKTELIVALIFVSKAKFSLVTNFIFKIQDKEETGNFRKMDYIRNNTLSINEQEPRPIRTCMILY